MTSGAPVAPRSGRSAPGTALRHRPLAPSEWYRAPRDPIRTAPSWRTVRFPTPPGADGRAPFSPERAVMSRFSTAAATGLAAASLLLAGSTSALGVTAPDDGAAL